MFIFETLKNKWLKIHIMTIIIGAAQKEYAFMIADTQVTRGDTKIYYPSKVMLRETEVGPELIGFSGILPFWEFYCSQQTNSSKNGNYLSNLEYNDIRKHFTRVPNGLSLSTKGRYSRHSSLMSVTLNSHPPIRKFSGRLVHISSHYMASGSGGDAAIEVLSHSAPYTRWKTFSRPESVKVLLQAYQCCVDTVVGCGGTPIIYQLKEGRGVRFQEHIVIGMQRIERGYSAGLITSKTSTQAIDDLLENADFQEVEQFILRRSRKAGDARRKLLDVLHGFYVTR